MMSCARLGEKLSVSSAQTQSRMSRLGGWIISAVICTLTKDSANSMCQLFANISLSRDNKVCQHCSRENRVFANIRCGEKVDSCITHGTGLQV
jgi:hypothetical protein